MDTIKVSVIVPVYGVEKYIQRCALSLFKQTYANCEFIFVNDCTEDKSIELLNSVICEQKISHQSIKIIDHEYNKGLAEARNTGVRAATGDYVLHVDSDDTIAPTTVEKCLKLATETNADVVIFGMLHVRKGKNQIEHVSIPTDLIVYLNQLISRENNVCLCGGLYKRSLYVDNNVWAIPGLNMGEDYSTKPRLLYYANKVVGLDEPLYIYNHLNEYSYTQSFSSKRVQDVTLAVKVLSEFFSKVPNSEFFVDSLNLAALRSKVLLLKSWALSKGTEVKFEVISSLYRDIPISIVKNLLDRIILMLSIRRNKVFLKYFVKLGYIVKSIFK